MPITVKTIAKVKFSSCYVELFLRIIIITIIIIIQYEKTPESEYPGFLK